MVTFVKSIFIIVFSSLFIGCAAMCASIEMQSHRSVSNPLARAVNVLPGPALVPSTLHSHHFLQDCSALFLSQRSLLLQGFLGAEFLACEAMAEDIAEARPTQGLAWLVLGLAAELEGDAASAAKFISISQSLNPHERFLAQQRTALHHLLLIEATQPPSPGFWQDAQYAASSVEGRQMFANLYLKNLQVRTGFNRFIADQPDYTVKALLREIERVLDGTAG